MVLSQENKPQMHSNQGQIACQTGVSLLLVNRIIRKDLRLTCLKRRSAHEPTGANKILNLQVACKEYISHVKQFSIVEESTFSNV